MLLSSLSKAETETREFYDRWIGESGLLSILGRLIFTLSGVVYSRTFVRVSRLTSSDKVLEIGCGMGTILRSAQRRVSSTESYLGIDLSCQMISKGKARVSTAFDEKPVELLVASGLSLPVSTSLFDVVLLSHVIKYLTDEQLHLVLWETTRVLRPGGRIVLWEFNPVLTPIVTGLILRYCRAQRLRGSDELKIALKTAGYCDLTSFRIITPWLPWSNVAFTGRFD